jgi:hypothetical protein
MSPADHPNDISEHYPQYLWEGQAWREELQRRCCAGVLGELFFLVLRVCHEAQPRHNHVRGLTWLSVHYAFPPAPNNCTSRYYKTPLKISLIFLFEAIPEICKPFNWPHALALVCAGSGVISRVMVVY